MNYAQTAFALLPLLATVVGARVAAQDDAPAAKAHKLTVQAKAGAKAGFRAESTQAQVIAAMNRETETKLVTDYDVEVLSAEADGSLKIKLTWRRLSGSLSSPMGGGIEFDSADKDAGSDDPMLGSVIDVFLSMVGKSVELTVGANGEVADRKPVVKMVESLMEGAEGMGRMMMQGLLSDSALATQAQVFGTYSKDAVAIGGTWKHEDKTGGRGGLKMKTEATVKLAAYTAETCHTTLAGTIAVDKSKTEAASTEGGDDQQAEMMRSMMAEATIENGKVSGETIVSRKDGMIQSATSTTSMEIAMPNPMGGDEPFIVKVVQTSKFARRDATAKAAAPAKK